MQLLACPSNARGSIFSDYAGCHHDVEAPIDVTNNGVFFLNSKIRYDDVTDGSSHTLYIGEKVSDMWDMEWMSGTRATLRNTGTPFNATLTAMRTQRATVPFGTREPRPEDPLMIPELDEPKEEVDTSGTAPVAGGPTIGPGNPLFVGGFSSVHPQVLNVAFGDGHVQTLSVTITGTVLNQLGHRADGQLPPSF